MQYLNTDHQPPPYMLEGEGVRWNAQDLIDTQATAIFAKFGYFPHYFPDYPCWLGIAWEERDGAYYGTSVGTPEQRAQVATSQKHMKLRKEVWPEQVKQRKAREANDVLNAPDSTAMQRIEALQVLNTL